MPDLRGLSARAAVRTLARVGLVPRLAGSGFVTDQQPDAGSPLRGDESVTLKLVRAVDAGRRLGAPMTLSALLAALVAPGLLTRAPAVPSAAEATVVTEVAYDSRRVGPGSLFVALRGLKADGTEFASVAAARGAVAIVSEAVAPSAVSAPWIVVPDARLALAVLADRAVGTPEPRAESRRHHRHQRQDDHRVSDAVDSRGGRPEMRPARDGRLQRRRSRSRSHAHDARSAGRAAHVPADGLQRLSRGGDGSVVARARAEARGRHALLGGGLQQPHARPPRLPRRHGVVLPGEAAALRAASAGGARRHQPRRPEGRVARAGRSARDDVRRQAAGRRRARAVRALAPRPDVHRAHAARTGCGALVDGRPAESLQHPRRRRDRRRARSADPRLSKPASRTFPACRDASRWSRRPSTT